MPFIEINRCTMLSKSTLLPKNFLVFHPLNWLIESKGAAIVFK
jgi:hypothetical protein